MLRFKLKKSLLFFFLMLIGAQSSVFAQILDPVKWETSVEMDGAEAILVMKAKIDKGWHLYSQNLPSDEGPVATSFFFNESGDYDTKGKVKESKSVTHYDPNFEMDLNYFEGTATFKQKITIKSASDFTVSGYVNYMVCDEGRCLPPKDVDLEFSVKGVSGVKTGDAGDSGDDEEAVDADDEGEASAAEGDASAGDGHGAGNGAAASGGILEPVKWSYAVENAGNGLYEFTMTATVDEGWHVYSQTLESLDGPVPTAVVFPELPEGVTLDGPASESGELHKEYDPNFEMELSYYSHEMKMTQRFKVEGTELPKIEGFLEFMTCDAGRCLPPKIIDLYVDLSTMKAGDVSELDAGNTAATDTSVIATSDCEPVGDACCAKTFQGGEELEVSYWSLMVEAFLFGLISLLTPCVFPMIPMTVSFFMKDGEKASGKGIGQALFYGISIILIYTAAGTLVAVLFGADFANWLATHWLPNTLFFLIFILFAASFFGMFEITLPSWLVNKSDAQVDKGGWLGPFFMAFTLVLVSFSCTGPIVGSLLIKAATSEGFMAPMLGMFAFSLAFALPFTLFAVFPKWLNSLPQSGGWLNSVKVVLGFIEVALGLKFLSVADQTYHWGILDREVYLALWIVVFSLMGAYLLGKLKFSHDSDMPYIKVPRLFMAICTLSFVVYLIPGMWGAPLKALSGYLPPMASHDFDLVSEIRGDHGGGGPCGDAKYSDFLHLPHGLQGYFDFDEAIACAREQQKPLFIDFTGHGCVNCREMEANVWSDDRVLKMLKEDFVVVAIYVDDKTELPEEEWYDSKFDGKTKKTIGAQNLDFQMCSFNANAQPLYCLLDNDENLLAPKRGYDLDADAFVEFLEGAKKLFDQRSVAQQLAD